MLLLYWIKQRNYIIMHISKQYINNITTSKQT